MGGGFGGFSDSVCGTDGEDGVTGLVWFALAVP